MKKINAEIIADSIDKRGNRITSFILTYPRFIHSELMTHRMFSRNSASSRAIPFEKMLKMVEEDPFIPIAWQKNHSGMQGVEYITDTLSISNLINQWLTGKDNAVKTARGLYKGAYTLKVAVDENGYTMRGFDRVEIPNTSVTKQLINRLLEPFMWHTVLVTATEYDNFFELRCPKYRHISDITHKTQYLRSKSDWLFVADDGTNLLEEHNRRLQKDPFLWYSINESQAEIHIQALAECMWDAYNKSTPKLLQSNEWHLPFGDQISTDDLHDYGIVELDNFYDIDELKLAISSVRCARLSYMTFENEIDYYKDMELYFRLVKSKHLSPFEHIARCMTDLEYYSFVKGKYPTNVDKWGIINYECYPFVTKPMFDESVGVNSKNPDIYGWCNNFRGFIPYRYLIENNGKI